MVLADIAKSIPEDIPFSGLIKNITISLAGESKGIDVTKPYLSFFPLSL